MIHYYVYEIYIILYELYYSLLYVICVFIKNILVFNLICFKSSLSLNECSTENSAPRIQTGTHTNQQRVNIWRQKNRLDIKIKRNGSQYFRLSRVAK